MSYDEPQGSTPAVPVSLAMLICDGLHKDPTSGKFTLLGTFSAIAAARFPVVHPVICVYFAFTDGYGTVPITIHLIQIDDDEGDVTVWQSVASPIVFEDPRAVVEGAAVIQNVSFDRPGEYRLQIKTGETILMERRLILIDQNAESSDTP